MKIQAHSSLEPQLEHNQDKSRLLLTFLTILRARGRLCSFRLVLERKAGGEIPQSSTLEFLEKFLANDFTLSDEEDKTSGCLIEELWQFYLY